MRQVTRDSARIASTPCDGNAADYNSACTAYIYGGVWEEALARRGGQEAAVS